MKDDNYKYVMLFGIPEIYDNDLDSDDEEPLTK